MLKFENHLRNASILCSNQPFPSGNLVQGTTIVVDLAHKLAGSCWIHADACGNIVGFTEVILVISLSYSLPALPVPMLVIVIAILVDIVIMSSSYLQGKR